MPEMMKAAVIAGERNLEIVERDIPVPVEGEVLVKIHDTGICGSDIHGFEGLVPDRRKIGLIMGHEASGEVVDTGKSSSRWQTGKRVAVDPQISCGRCAMCARGHRHLCDNRLNLGSTMNTWLDGTLCEYVALPETQLHEIPDNVSFSEAAVVEPASCAIHIFNRGIIEVGCSVAVIGTGTVGLMAIQVAALMGADLIVGVDILDDRLTLAKRLGANVTINSKYADPVACIMDETDGRGVDSVVEAAGLSLTYDWAIRSVKKRGQVFALGYIDEHVTFPMRHLIFREVTVLGCTGFTHEIDTALHLLSGERIDVKPIITHRYKLREIQQAFETAADLSTGAIKVMIEP